MAPKRRDEGPGEIILALALNRLRALDREAEAGWPKGYDREATRVEVAELVATVEAAIAALPEPGRRDAAKRYAAEINAR